MLLIRHNKLLPPYNDYSTLSVEMLDNLALDIVSPSIAELPSSLNWDEDVVERFKNAEYFFCSDSVRTRKTGEMLMQRFGVEKEIIEDRDLKEIHFVPSKLMENKDENPLDAVRRNLYPGILNKSTAVEDSDALCCRAERLLEKYSDMNCMLFSHGFFIRFLDSYCGNGMDLSSAITNIQSARFVDYLSCREV